MFEDKGREKMRLEVNDLINTDVMHGIEVRRYSRSWRDKKYTGGQHRHKRKI